MTHTAPRRARMSRAAIVRGGRPGLRLWIVTMLTQNPDVQRYRVRLPRTLRDRGTGGRRPRRGVALAYSDRL
jgi:hypothetical protein